MGSGHPGNARARSGGAQALRHSTPLQPFNGRDARNDLQQELLDALVYNKQAKIKWDWLMEKLKVLHVEVMYPRYDLDADGVLTKKVIPILNEIKERLHLVG